jgi:hypothetical protein
MNTALRAVLAVLALLSALAGGYAAHDVLTADDETGARAELVAATAPQGQPTVLPPDAGVVIVEVVAGTPKAVAGEPTIADEIPSGLLALSSGQAPGTTATESGWVAVVVAAPQDTDQLGTTDSPDAPHAPVARGPDRARETASPSAASRLVVAAPVGFSGPMALVVTAVLLLLAVGLLIVALIGAPPRPRRIEDPAMAAPVPDRRRGPRSDTGWGPATPDLSRGPTFAGAEPGGRELVTPGPRQLAAVGGAPAPTVAAGSSGPGDDSGGLISHVIEVRDVVPQRALAARLDAGLSTVGIEPFDPTGEPFDGRHHHVVDVRVTTDPTLVGTVAATERVGYYRGGVLYRAADVVVYHDRDEGHRS